MVIFRNSPEDCYSYVGKTGLTFDTYIQTVAYRLQLVEKLGLTQICIAGTHLKIDPKPGLTQK
jgi:hypothetical protein